MAALGISLNSVGISQAKGVDVVMLRDQIDATLPRDKTKANTAQGQAAEQQTQTSARQKFAAKELTPEQQRQIAQLQQIDRTVRAHEQAHLSAGRGVVTSAANFGYVYGPDGKQYAVSGEVGIDTSPEEKPEANIDKGIRIQAAALAPKDPSPQDYRVASVGSQLEAQGRSDLSRQRAEERVLETERSSQASDEAQRQTEEGESVAGTRQRLSQAYSADGTAGNGTLNVFA